MWLTLLTARPFLLPLEVDTVGLSPYFPFRANVPCPTAGPLLSPTLGTSPTYRELPCLRPAGNDWSKVAPQAWPPHVKLQQCWRCIPPETAIARTLQRSFSLHSFCLPHILADVSLENTLPGGLLRATLPLSISLQITQHETTTEALLVTLYNHVFLRCFSILNKMIRKCQLTSHMSSPI